MGNAEELSLDGFFCCNFYLDCHCRCQLLLPIARWFYGNWPAFPDFCHLSQSISVERICVRFFVFIDRDFRFPIFRKTECLSFVFGRHHSCSVRKSESRKLRYCFSTAVLSERKTILRRRY